MVRKLKIKKIRNISNNVFASENSDNFIPIRPLKSELQEVLRPGEHRKIEILNYRYELRISALEREVINDLKSKGINISEEIRKSILRLNKSLVKEKIKEVYLEKSKRLNVIEKEITNLKQKIKLEKYKNYYCIKNETGYNYSNNHLEIQKMINNRYKMKYKLDDLEREYKQLKKFINKYQEFF